MHFWFTPNPSNYVSSNTLCISSSLCTNGKLTKQGSRSFEISGLPLSYFLARAEVLSCNSSNNLKCLSRRIHIEVFEALTHCVEPV